MKKVLKSFSAVGLSVMLASMSINPSVAMAKIEVKQLNPKSVLSKEQKSFMSDNSFIIKYKKPLTALEHKALGGQLVRQVSELKYAEIKVTNKKQLLNVMKKYQKKEKVESVSPNYYVTKSGVYTDPNEKDQYQHSMLQTKKALSLAGKNKVTVAVIDDGVDINHPDLKSNVLSGYNAANPANQPIAGTHGTHVSGIIGAEKNNKIGGYGINPNIKILPIDVFDGEEVAYNLSITNAILYAIDNGAKVINMSLRTYVSSPVLEEAIKKAIGKGVVVVAAAGNESVDFPTFPANYEGVISVGSIDKNKKLSSYSNFGPAVDIVAPGEGIFSTSYDAKKKSTFQVLSGTSMASPIVAGAAALVLSKNPKLTPAQVEYVLEKTADDLGEKGFDTMYAHGLVNLTKAVSYNTSEIPTTVKNVWNDKEIVEKAENVDASKKVIKNVNITKPYEQKWIKFPVKKGEYVQTILSGSKQYDYKIMIKLYGQNGETDVVEVNQSQEGTKEAKLYKANFDGTIAIGVKDVNGNYDDSGKNGSHYKLEIEKATSLPKEQSNIENMIPITKLPYKSSEVMTLAGENGHNDYFKIKVTDKQLVQLNISGIPGLNTDIAVYNGTALFDSDISETDKVEQLKSMLEGDNLLIPEFYSNKYGVSQAERLSFMALPDQEYIIRVAGDAYTATGMDAFFGANDMNASLRDKDRPSSIIPYQFEVKSTILPDDEDGLNLEMINGDQSDQDLLTMLLEEAQPFDLNTKVSGYIQEPLDLDCFVLEPTKTAIYELSLRNEEGIVPNLELYEITSESDEEGNEFLYQSYIGDNAFSSLSDNTKKMYIGLKKDKRYIARITSLSMNEGQIDLSLKPYELSAKVVVSNPPDAFEPNSLTNPITLSKSSFTATLSMPNDVDTYSFTAKSDGIKAIAVKTLDATSYKKKYPKEIVGTYKPIVSIYEDRNKNGMYDASDELVTTTKMNDTPFATTSFKVKKGVKYYVSVEAIYDDVTLFSLIPYQFTIVDVNKKDESTRENPVTLKTKNNLQQVSGYFNAGIVLGDKDYYTFTVKKNSTVKVMLEAGSEADGVIEIYQNGKLLKTSDLYGQGNNEQLILQLKKGNYQVKISDANGVASVTSYTLKVQMK